VKIVGKAGNCKGFSFDSNLLARFDFSGQIDNNSFPSVSPDQQKKFQADFVSQFEKVRDQLLKYKWLSADAILPPRVTSGPCCPPSDFHVFISDAYDLSRSLVPAWHGQRGWMEFPAHRVLVGGATIAHELVHVLFPNGNRMLAEGLATYLQHKLLPRLPVFPNYGDALEVVVEEFLRVTFPNDPTGALWSMDLEGLEGISTPDDLFMRVGTRPFIGGDPARPEIPDSQQTKFLYAVAGSFVGFLLENPIEDEGILTEKNFGTLYLSSPLRPLERDSGAADRWQNAYRNRSKSFSFKELSLLWKTYMHFVLFSDDAKKPSIPDNYRRVKLVSELYAKLQEIASQGSGQPPARAPRKAGE
jgi:hypothetical protein